MSGPKIEGDNGGDESDEPGETRMFVEGSSGTIYESSVVPDPHLGTRHVLGDEVSSPPSQST